MHIPDGFLSGRIWLSLDALSSVTVLYAARRLRVQASGHTVPLMGVLSAFVFAAQLLNFPVLGGTSGHLVGSALLAVLLGPLAAFLTMVTVLIAQALFLQDGGLAALGANIFNIATVPVLSGYGIFRLAGGTQSHGRRLAIASFLSGWVSIELCALCCALELSLSGAIPLRVGLPAMTGYHAILGVAEGILTSSVLVFLSHTRPDLIRRGAGSRLPVADWVAVVALVAVPCAILVLAGSSNLPDPLQRLLASADPVYGRQGESEPFLSPLRYREFLRALTLIAGAIGSAYFLGRLMRGKRSKL